MFHFELLVLAFVFLGCSGIKTDVKKTNAVTANTISDNIRSVRLEKKEVAKTFPCEANINYYLKKDVDLKGERYVMPEGVTIFAGKGIIKNGTLIGNNTKLKGKGCFFDRVTIEGAWMCKDISTSMFKSLDYDNSLVNVFALANHRISNTVTIEKGLYNVSIGREVTAISIPSNTTVFLNGEIKLLPNKYDQCYIFDINNAHSITIKGTGKIVGDRLSHLGTTGEWGFGIRIKHSKNVLIEGISISHCWGDCIYICDKSENIRIRNCNLHNSRRQGISVISANDVNISNCDIYNISGIAPGSAIDVEPNANDTVRNVTISKVRARDCIIGFAASGNENMKRYTEKVKFLNCQVTRVKGIPITIVEVNNVIVDNCDLDCTAKAYTVYLKEVRNASVTNNVLSSEKYIFNSTKSIRIKGNRIRKGIKAPLFGSF